MLDGVDLVLGATEKFNVTSYINDLTKNDIGEVHSCEIEDADTYVGAPILLEIELGLF